ncbi:MAG: VWA domain-containing protein [Candidatus Bathyarchaeia archaeon]
MNSQEPEFPHIEASKTVTPARVVEGGTIQFRIHLVGAGGMVRTPVDVVLVLDRSGSMTGRKIEDAKAAAITFLDYTGIEDRVGLVTYSNTIEPTELQVMDPAGKETIKTKIRSQQAGGSTNIYDSIATAEQLLLSSPRTNAPPVIILLTDGLHNWPSLLPNSAFQAQAEEATSRGIIIYTIGLGHDADKERLKMIAEITGGDFYFAATSEELEQIYIEIGEKLAFAGTNIKVTETIPSYITYNNDASKTPAEQTGDTLVWTIGHLKVGQEWEVTYTATAARAVEINPDLIMAKVEYTTAIGSTAIINLPPGLIYHDIALSDYIVDPLKVFAGEIISSQFAAHNRGTQQESFVLQIQFDGTVLDSRTITLGAGESLVINFDWNTTGVDDGKYNLTVIADPEGTIWETDRSDNQLSQQVEVKVTAGNLWFFIIIFLLVMILTTGGIAYVKMKPAVTRPTEPTYVCPNCRSPLQYNPRIGQWYCYKCRRYYRERQPTRLL